jgi:cytochrome c biogenesis protein CcdA
METMGTSNIPLVAAFFLGLMVAISPCPMATNITAIAYISKKVGDSKHTLLVGILYTLGRMFTYVAISATIVWLGMNLQIISTILQDYGELLIGPLLIIIGILMLDLVKINLPTSKTLSSLQERLSNKGPLGGFLLGAIFALAFCPFSAMLFFGLLIPLAIKTGDGILVPSVFALATGLPVIIFAYLLSKSVSKLGKRMKQVETFEKWMRKIVAAIFILIGAYLTSSTLGFGG